ncbi:BaiN/RdsA family NAD(P)/FAD-dependent oxidoreductase [Hymenobacter latericus]|uniref:NAD(P)/FAD-dependent oxidoreductase n=1 Tax=Hymenobacter sp. YIM 151858-1 TaxID=2987688 RepID=UPI002226ABDD|nr:TIGR03862 family flavoprotein [Hymenobacter sp. YIM 151858-1]UYZ59892.1 TIGR03862 family flavoprotein [Hymenobacter sp. YIM 151858-1]
MVKFAAHTPMQQHPTVAIIGGGPAGLVAAQHLAEAGVQGVAVYEAQATPGRKFLVAGHGGFNLTNGEPVAAFGPRYGHRRQAFEQYLGHFGPAELRRWAAQLGIATYVGSSGRVFPLEEHKPAHLLRAWLQRLEHLGVQLHTRHRWLGFGPGGGLLMRNERTGTEFSVAPRATLLALGGASWAKTGSDGQWLPVLEQALGLQSVPFRPSNCGVEVAWSAFFREKVGRTPLKNVLLRCGQHEARGEVMLTEYGLEGTPVYALTPAIREALQAQVPAQLLLNLKPDLGPAEVLQRLQQARRGRSLPDVLRQHLKLGPPIPTLLREVAPAATLADTARLAKLLQALPLPITALRPLDEAISTAGGVPFEEVNEHLMLLRRPGVFVAGEMLDWEAPTGGYLLQGCFSTGAWAARGMAQWLQHTAT